MITYNQRSITREETWHKVWWAAMVSLHTSWEEHFTANNVLNYTNPRYWKGKGSFSFNLKMLLKIDEFASLTSSSLHDDNIVAFPIRPLSPSFPLSRPLGQGIPEWNRSKDMQTTSFVTSFTLLVEPFLHLGFTCWNWRCLCSKDGSWSP